MQLYIIIQLYLVVKQLPLSNPLDGGFNWGQISSGVLISGSYNGSTVNDQGSYDLCLSVHPTNPNIVCFGNVELSRTTNGSTISFVRNP